MQYIPIKVDERYGYKTEKYRCYMVQTSSYDNSVEAFSHEYKYWFMDLMDKKSIADVWIDGVKNYSACDDCGNFKMDNLLSFRDFLIRYTNGEYSIYRERKNNRGAFPQSKFFGELSKTQQNNIKRMIAAINAAENHIASVA